MYRPAPGVQHYPLKNNYLKQAQANVGKIRNNWRDFHTYPELGFQETRPAEKVVRYLDSLPGLEVETGIAGTGVLGLLYGGHEGNTVASLKGQGN